jgi:hypothetical protein
VAGYVSVPARSWSQAPPTPTSMDRGAPWTGVDVQLSLGAFAVAGEYLVRQMGLTSADQRQDSGFCAQGLYDFGRCCFLGRPLRPAPGGCAEQLTQPTVGAGWVVQERREVRLERQLNRAEQNNTFLQLVV